MTVISSSCFSLSFLSLTINSSANQIIEKNIRYIKIWTAQSYAYWVRVSPIEFNGIWSQTKCALISWENASVSQSTGFGSSSTFQLQEYVQYFRAFFLTKITLLPPLCCQLSFAWLSMSPEIPASHGYLISYLTFHMGFFLHWSLCLKVHWVLAPEAAHTAAQYTYGATPNWRCYPSACCLSPLKCNEGEM